VRGTVGGDHLPSSVAPSTLVVSLPCVNIIFNSVVFTDAYFGSVDLTDFYLGTPLATSQFIKNYTNIFSPEVLSRLFLLLFLKQDKAGKPYILISIEKTMYGLKEAGKLSNLRLVSLLQSLIFTKPIPPVFSVTPPPYNLSLGGGRLRREVLPTLLLCFFVSCLSTLYHVKAHPIASSFLGFPLDHNRSNRTFTVSYYPGYVFTLLTRLRPLGVANTSSPFIYIPPAYGSSEPQSPTSLDTSPPATTSQSKDLQTADSCRLPTVLRPCRGPSLLARNLDPGLGAGFTHFRHHDPTRPPPRLRWRPPQRMQTIPRLRTPKWSSTPSPTPHTFPDPRAGSVASSSQFLGDHSVDTPLNHPILTHSTRIPVVDRVLKNFASKMQVTVPFRAQKARFFP
jgi:hypothetical protein